VARSGPRLIYRATNWKMIAQVNTIAAARITCRLLTVVGAVRVNEDKWLQELLLFGGRERLMKGHPLFHLDRNLPLK